MCGANWRYIMADKLALDGAVSIGRFLSLEPKWLRPHPNRPPVLLSLGTRPQGTSTRLPGSHRLAAGSPLPLFAARRGEPALRSGSSLFSSAAGPFRSPPRCSTSPFSLPSCSHPCLSSLLPLLSPLLSALILLPLTSPGLSLTSFDSGLVAGCGVCMFLVWVCWVSFPLVPFSRCICV